MNVTVVIPRPLQAACEGRSTIELGVPPRSGVGDIIYTLIALYPGLRKYVANEAPLGGAHFGVAQAGERLFLFANSPAARTH